MQIEVGDIFLLQCQTCRTPKPKFFVVAMLDPLRCFLINSVATDFQQTQQAIMSTLAHVSQAEHPFLEYDSLVGCNMLFGEYSAEEITAVIAANRHAYKGKVGPNGAAAIGAALKGNKLLPGKYLAPLQALWPVSDE